MFFSKKKLIGLDIGTSTIKLAELDVGRKSASLLSFGMTPTPPQATAAGDVVDPQAISVAIRELVNEVKTKRKLVSTGLWGNSVIVKRITIPKMDENLISEQIRWEAEQYIPFDINEVNLEFKVLKNTPQGQGEVMDVLLVAAVQSMIFKVVEMVELSALSCAVLDVEGFALANCFEKNYGRINGQTIGLLNIGSNVTNFVVVENGEVIFCRDIPVGGMTYNNELQKGLNMSRDEAEAIKMSASMNQAAPEEASNIIQSTHEVVMDEINGSIEFFLNTSQASQLSQLFITGGCARMPGLKEQISSKYACERLNPFLAVTPTSRQFTPGYLDQIRDFAAVAIGLGLRGLGDS